MRIVIWVVLVTHGDFDLLEDREHVVGFEELVGDVREDAQNKLIEEFPFVFEELGEEACCDLGVGFRQN